jgi:uroporphyrinogen III methyltransferase / synthase
VSTGRVILVGAGPGDPGLMTVRALEAIGRADVILYDKLIPATALDGARPDAELIDVGKVGGGEQVPQDETKRLLLEHARAGRVVVRLKGGDPFVFGRGGEEALALAEAGVPYEVVPGVSAVSAVPASAGIPVTHRGVSAQVTLVSGHSASGEELDYEHLAKTPGTLVVFMGLNHLPEIVDGLLAAGKDPHTPAAVVSNGTRPDGQAVTGTLAEIVSLVSELVSPALLVVGDVVAVAALIRQPSATLSSHA